MFFKLYLATLPRMERRESLHLYAAYFLIFVTAVGILFLSWTILQNQTNSSDGLPTTAPLALIPMMSETSVFPTSQSPILPTETAVSQPVVPIIHTIETGDTLFSIATSYNLTVAELAAANNIAEILSDQGHLDDAEGLFEQALRAWRRAGYEVGVAVGTAYLGRLRARRGDYDDARVMLADAAVRFERIGASHFVLETKAYQLECEVLAGNGRAAIADIEPLFEMADELGDPLLEAMLLRAKGWAHLIEREYEQVEELANRCVILSESVGSLYEAALALIMRGQALRATGRDRTDDHRRAREMLTELGVVSLPRRAGA